METSKNNSAIEIDQRGPWSIEKIAVGRIEVTLGIVDHFT